MHLTGANRKRRGLKPWFHSRGGKLDRMNRIQRDGLCLDSETGEHKLILSILLILSELYLDSEAGDPDSQSKWRSRRWRIESLFSVCSCSSPEPGRFRKAFMGVADDRR